jgi:hypothetical protein
MEEKQTFLSSFGDEPDKGDNSPYQLLHIFD